VTSRISHSSIDSHNAYEQSVWWCQVLGFADDPQDPNRPGDEECMIFSADGRTRVLFIEVPDDKVVKNRVHFDVSPTDRTRDEEVERLRELGATVFADHRNPDGSGWVTMADPEESSTLQTSEKHQVTSSMRGLLPHFQVRRRGALARHATPGG
jgi:hypothetical protein